MTFKPTFAAVVVASLLSGCATYTSEVQPTPVLAPVTGQSVSGVVPCDQLSESVVNKVHGCEGFIPMPALTSQQAAEIALLNAKLAAEVSPVVNFDFNKDVLTANAAAIVDGQAAWMRRYPQIRFSVFGHTDLVGSEGYNFDLAKRRAETVVGRLILDGVNGDQLDALVSYGKTRPLINTTSPEPINRRTVTEVTGYLEKPRLYAVGPVNCAWIKASFLPNYPICVSVPSALLPPAPPPPPPATIVIQTQSYNSGIDRPATSTSARYSNDGTTQTSYADSQAGDLNTSAMVSITGDVTNYVVNGEHFVAGPNGADPHRVAP